MVQTRLVILFVMLLGLAACKIDRRNTIDRDRITFRYTEDALLFFKNVRQIYYDFHDLPAARWYAYRYSDRRIDPQKPVLTPVIVIDWVKNEAYILVETNEFFEKESSLKIVETTAKGTRYSYSLSERGRENMIEFSTKIYEGIMDENKIEIVIGDTPYDLFSDETDRDHFRVVMADYYRLTRVF